VSHAHLIWAALRRRPVRTLLTALSIITAFLLFGALQGIDAGIASLIDSIKATHLRVSSRVGIAQTLPLSHVTRIASVPGVTAVTGIAVLMSHYQRPGNNIMVLACELEPMFRIYTELKVPAAQLTAAVRKRSGALVAAPLAAEYGWKIGDRIPVRVLNVPNSDGSFDWTFEVAGFYEHEQPELASQVLVNLAYVNEARTQGKNTVAQFAVGIDDARHSARISQAIDDSFANSPHQTLTQTEKDFAESGLRRIGDIGFLINAIVGAVLFALFFLTANTMAQSVRERIPELAVLKTVGFTDATVQWLVLGESLLLCGVAALVGLAAAVAILPVVVDLRSVGLGAMRVPASVFAGGMAVAVVMALASGIPLALKARRLDIATALTKG
jgi:putative ABC transport system permease protein